jgi:hypothetical protein
MLRPQRLFELLFLLALIAGLAFMLRRQEKPPEDHSYFQLRMQVRKDWNESKLEACSEGCKLLLSKEPGDLFAIRYLGLISLRQGDLKSAQQFFDEGIESTKATDWSSFLVGQNLGCLYRDRARLKIVQKDWPGAVADATKAKELIDSWEEDHKLAQDAWICAQVGAGNVTEAKLAVESHYWWQNSSISALTSQHAKKLDPEVELYDGHPPLWHPTPCPLCP